VKETAAIEIGLPLKKAATAAEIVQGGIRCGAVSPEDRERVRCERSRSMESFVEASLPASALALAVKRVARV
jgi:hypothetical protein